MKGSSKRKRKRNKNKTKSTSTSKMSFYKTYPRMTKRQLDMISKEGDNPFEPRWLYCDEEGRVRYQKFNDKNAILVDDWRCWVKIDGKSHLVGIRDWFSESLTKPTGKKYSHNSKQHTTFCGKVESHYITS